MRKPCSSMPRSASILHRPQDKNHHGECNGLKAIVRSLASNAGCYFSQRTTSQNRPTPVGVRFFQPDGRTASSSGLAKHRPRVRASACGCLEQ